MIEDSAGRRDDAEERLKQLGKKIDSAREQAKEAIEGSADDGPGNRFVESGNEQATPADDQTIAPG
jgi:hypothetical protein